MSSESDGDRPPNVVVIRSDDRRYDGPLASWHELGWPSYSGRGGYETTFAVAELRSDARYEIDLGQVFETARLWLNDKLIGDRASGTR